MPERAPRINGYAELIAPLVDARQESMLEREANQEALAAFAAMLREYWPSILRRDWHGTVIIELVVRRGIIEQDIQVTERRTKRLRD